MKKLTAFWLLHALWGYPFTAWTQSFHLPVVPFKITSPFGARRHPVTAKADFHAGIDLGATGALVRSVLAGRVVERGYHPFLGYFVRISHGEIQSTYGHLSLIKAKLGAEIPAGRVIGISGRSGRVSGEHLHFAVRYHGEQIDPLKFLFFLQSTETQNKTR